jgi:hypothetical protein
MQKNFLSKNKKPIIIIGSLIITGVITYLLIKKSRSNKVPGINAPLTEQVSNGISWPIKKKAASITSSAEQAVIRNIQDYLNSKIDNYVEERLVIDGFFGDKTEAMAQKILGVKTISYSLYQEILNKI